MKDPDYIDVQILGAFVDDELDAEHRETIIMAMEADPEVRGRVYRLRRAKDLMKLGFGDASAPSGHTGSIKGDRWRSLSSRIAASIAALAVSFGAGMFGYKFYSGLEDSQLDRAVASISNQQADKLMLHVRESDPKQFAAALSYTENFLQMHKSGGLRVEVIAHGGGLDMMRDEVSPLKAQILTMMEKHDNVHFIACADTIRILRSQGAEPGIIKGISTNVPAFDHIIERLQSGDWKYIRVESLSEVQARHPPDNSRPTVLWL